MIASLHNPALRTVVCAAVLFLPTAHLHAQTDRAELERPVPSSADTAKLVALMNRAFDLQLAGNLDSCFTLIEQADQLATRTGAHRFMVDARIALSSLNMEFGRIMRSRAMLEQTLGELDPKRHAHDIARVQADIGLGYHHEGDMVKALDHYLQGLALFEVTADTAEQIRILNNVATLYTGLHRNDEALATYDRALALMRDHDDPLYPAILGGQAKILMETGELEKAKALFRASIPIAERINERNMVAESYLMLGVALMQQDSLTTALRSFRTAEPFYDLQRGVVTARINQADALGRSGRTREAIDLLRKTLVITADQGLLAERAQILLLLSDQLETKGEVGPALDLFKQHIAVRDSLFNEERTRETTRIGLRYEFDKEHLADSLANAAEKQRMQLENDASVAKEKNRRNVLLFSGIGLLGLAGGLYTRLRHTRKSRAAIQKEKDISEGLLLNILPAEVAEELKRKGYSDAQQFDKATILFTDFKGFTSISETLSPSELVEELNVCFKAFDHIITAHGIEKIKTIGDAYMCAGGLPDPKSSSPIEVVLAALEMQAFMKTRKAERVAQGKPAFEMRVGIHTGPVVAGIVGVKKFQYDIWGDTVNTASRMESSGEVGKVNISGDTYHLVVQETDLMFTPRGKIQAKGKGDLEMFFVEWRS